MEKNNGGRKTKNYTGTSLNKGSIGSNLRVEESSSYKNKKIESETNNVSASFPSFESYR
jgi:hypothetical protein